MIPARLGGPVIRSNAFFTLLATLVSLSMTGVSACRKEPPPAPAPREPWMVSATAIRNARDGSSPERCNAEGKDCKSLGAKETFEASGVVRTRADGRTSLEIGESTELELLDNSAIKFVPDGDGAVQLEMGSLVVHQKGKTAGKTHALHLPGTVASWPLDRSATFAIRMLQDGGAVLSVRQGLVKLQSEKNGSIDVLSGETVRLSRDKAPDKRAVWAGIESPVEFMENGRSLDPLPTSAPRGFGSMTARVPGTNETIQGVRLASHKVQVVVRDGFARTEIEEEFTNETDRVLEGRYMFPLPSDASISRLALWVGNDLVEGEVLERDRAKTIFQQIVDDTVRPRDPALLEWVAGSEFSLRIFPIPAKGSRKVVLAYNQILPAEGGRVHYVYPLSLGADRATKISDFSLSIRASTTEGSVGDIMTPGYAAAIATSDGKAQVDYSAKDFVPNDDFVVHFRSGNSGAIRTAAYTPKEGEFQVAAKPSTTTPTNTPKTDTPVAAPTNYFAVRLEAALPEGAPIPQRIRRDVVLTVDTSHSQSRETLDRTIQLVRGVLRQMDPDEQFVLLACDSACASYPEKGFSASTEAEMTAAEKWLQGKTPGGSSDISGSLLTAMERLAPGGSGQIIYLGDGSPTAGELSAETIATRVRAKLDPQKVDLRFLGTGRTVDAITLAGLARTLGGTFEQVHTGDHLEQRIAEIGMGLRAPVVRWMTATLPVSMKEVFPRQLPNVRLGQEIMLFGKMDGNAAGDIVLQGEFAGGKYELRRAIDGGKAATNGTSDKANPLVPRLWAEARIREAETSDEPSLIKEAVDLSKRFHVMSRHTAFLVLENERMFAEFGVQRTTRKADDQSDASFGAAPDAVASAQPAATTAGGGNAGPPPPMSAPRKSFDPSDLDGPAPRSKPMGRGWGHWVEFNNTQHSLETAEWNRAGEEELQKLRNALANSPQSRRARTALIRGLLQRGRFEDAMAEAQRFAEADPDSSDAHELVAHAAAARGDMQHATLEMDTQAELRPRRTLSHTLAARAFEAAGDERRACAHWRSAAELDPKSDDVLSEVFRCRARVFDGREAALRDAKALEKPGPRVKKIIEELEKSSTPAFTPWPGGHLLKAAVTCSASNGATLPHLIIINHVGAVISPWTPTQAPTGPGFAGITFSLPSGTYRTIVWGSDATGCELMLDAQGTTKKFPLSSGMTVVKTNVERSRRFVHGNEILD